jgi:hypothetical protein
MVPCPRPRSPSSPIQISTARGFGGIAEHVEALCQDLALNGSRHYVPHSTTLIARRLDLGHVKASLLPCDAIVGSHAVQ